MINAKVRRTAGLLTSAVAIGGAVALAPLQSASANEDFSSCGADGHVNNASVIYSLTNTKHVWQTIKGRVGGAQTGNKNNFNSRILDGGTTVWQWNSGDTWGYGEQYSKSIGGVQTTRVNTEKVRMETIFDEPGGDDKCTVPWDY